MLQRIIGVLKLDIPTYEDIEADQSATTQAAMVVAAVALVSGLGGVATASITGTGAATGFFQSFVSTFLGWIIWSAVTFFVGTKLFGGQADLGQMLRVIGFAFAPQLLSIIPCLGAIVGAIWTLVCGFIAVRQGLDLDNGKAAMTIGVGLLAYLAFLFVIGLVLGGGAALTGALTG